MPLYLVTKEYADEHTLMHYRTKGSKNGVRRYQNEDGSLTPEGYIHYGVGKGRQSGGGKDDNGGTGRGSKWKNFDGTLTKAGIDKFTYATPNPGQKRMNLAGRIRFGNKYANEFNKSQDKWTKEAQKKYEEDAKRDFLERSKAEDEERKRAKQEEQEAARRVDNNPWVEGSSANKQYGTAIRKLKEDYDELSPEERRKNGDVMLKAMDRYLKTYMMKTGDKNQLDDLDADVKRDADIHFEADQRWLKWQIDKVSGNENTGEYKEGSHGEAAHKTLMQHYDKLWDREEEVKRNIGYQEPAYNKNGFIANQKKADSEYQRLKEALAGDEVYQALKKNSDKSEKSLLNAVLRDLGFSTTPANRNAIEWIVFRD